jgi:hypothetical protein
MTQLDGFTDAAFAALMACFRHPMQVTVCLAFERCRKLEKLALPCKCYPWTSRRRAPSCCCLRSCTVFMVLNRHVGGE